MIEVALAVVPLLILLGSLLLGRYPGCDAILRLSERVARRGAPSRAAARAARPATPLSAAIRGTLLLAFGFAKRPPPLAS